MEGGNRAADYKFVTKKRERERMLAVARGWEREGEEGERRGREDRELEKLGERREKWKSFPPWHSHSCCGGERVLLSRFHSSLLFGRKILPLSLHREKYSPSFILIVIVVSCLMVWLWTHNRSSWHDMLRTFNPFPFLLYLPSFSYWSHFMSINIFFITIFIQLAQVVPIARLSRPRSNPWVSQQFCRQHYSCNLWCCCGWI